VSHFVECYTIQLSASWEYLEVITQLL